jgi:hypothetical protein
MRGLIHTECPALDAIRMANALAFVDERFVARKFSDHSRHEFYLLLLKSGSMWLAENVSGVLQLPKSGWLGFAECRKDTSNLGLLI